MSTLKTYPAYEWYLTQTKLTLDGSKYVGCLSWRGLLSLSWLCALNTFYEPLRIRYEQQYTSDIEHRPTLPLKRDGTVNMTQIREQLREIGHSGSYTSCKANNATRTYCHKSRRSIYDYFDYFTNNEEDN
ncbi:hypothetical protein N7449_001182 [Penicillium cf. viridicatum]|uniref:Uncharacterized protein n=1 Tax=Penicillium cf. viridicatum TaxID=2972119 RepID=A0A9W9N7Q7_9EURO|nr:hypothetical protein N7449_001182 [Penicillium cf. viridicatum]